MDLGVSFIILIIFGLIGFGTEKIWGLNPYKWYCDITALILISSILFLFIPIVANPEDIEGNINRVVTLFVKVLPAEIIGDLAGTFVAKLTGERR